MQLIMKIPVMILLILPSVFLLGACSPAAGMPTPLPVQATQSQPSTETLSGEISTANSPAPTEMENALSTETAVEGETATSADVPTEDEPAPIQADVLSVAASGAENAYQFAVEIRSPDTGCEQYADWWEVVSEDGALIYRRILAHSHVTEQPFRRSGGPVAIRADTVVIVRAHMHPGGYGGAAFRGSVDGGFEALQLEPGFAEGLEHVDPLPSGCGF
jgi:hypothetical protein